MPPTGPIKQSARPPKKRRRFRNFLLTLVILTSLSFGGGVWYSSVSDNFHDFFTEYVPFGEQAVLYFEERQFRQRFPNKRESQHLPERDERVTIPSKSGLSWRVAEDGSKDGKVTEAKAKAAQQTPGSATVSEKNAAVKKAKSEASSAVKTQSSSPDTKQTPKTDPAPEELTGKRRTRSGSSSAAPSPKTAQGLAPVGKKTPEVNEPSVWVPVGPIDPLAVQNADEPLVQDLVHILNDIITVANADNSTGKFSGAMNKAKSELATLGQRIIQLKEFERHNAEEKIKSTELDFDNAAKELVRRLESEMKEQEGRWREEFEAERSRLRQSFEEKLKTEVERSEKVSEEKVRNQLLEQAIALKKEFSAGVREQVETERQGRLAKLADISDSIGELQKLTTDWNQVVDSNLQTQHLLNAVEAVRMTLETADRPKPFVRELAALSEIAGDNKVVDTALSSITPAAYSYGILSSAQLVDRFRRVADEVRKAALLPENAGMASHATSYVLSKVMFKKEGRTDGSDVESVLLRTEHFLEEGALDDAARELNGLTGWAKTLSSDWLSEVRRVLEVRQALEVCSAQESILPLLTMLRWLPQKHDSRV